jgi:hypothetical protein
MTEQDLERWEAFSKALGTTCYLKVEGGEIPVLIHGIYPMDYIEVVYKGEIVNFPSWAQRQSIKVTDLDNLRFPTIQERPKSQIKPQIWDILEKLVQTNGTINRGNLTGCICCGDGIFTLPGKWKHTKECLLWRVRLLLDDCHAMQESVSSLDKRAVDLYYEALKLKLTNTHFAEWVEAIPF